ncbi:DNA-directed RNA polymerase subunit P [Ignisphaera sp. 4213-co]|uniref:DNA-directed RNA polymerase subunit Rpo12 n=1 Tax=Ignisphaera cupida TaxID=3050454 RepID=A0ABD4Z557_9CREN|nr:DNA-directed RNA polymerase subunit P [Ignisphaera sp. 4213-co]MDK6028451.1 DNA-directed RNA polymerase subunit P [Ignisphaera sp. 4213-co]
MAKYLCIRCGREFDESQLAVMMNVRCPYCGYKVIAKARSGEIKTIRAL